MSWWARLFGRAPADPIPPAPADTLGAATLTREPEPVSVQAVPLPHVAIPPVPRPVLITSGVVRAGFPRCADPEAWANAFSAAAARFPEFNLTGWACILAKARTEAQGLTRWDENLYYTTVGQIIRMHGSRAGLNPERLLRNPQALGDQVYAKWGGYAGRGLGVIQLTGLDNHRAFASAMGMSLDDARAYMLTIPGAAMTAPWYLAHYRAVDAANRGDMRAVLAVVAGKRVDQMGGIWAAIHGDQQMADYEMFRELLGA